MYALHYTPLDWSEHLALCHVKTIKAWKNSAQMSYGVNLHLGFSQIRKIDNNGIIANYVFTHICSFLLYLQHMMLDIWHYKSVDIIEVTDFIGAFNFWCHSYRKLAKLALFRVCEIKPAWSKITLRLVSFLCSVQFFWEKTNDFRLTKESKI